MPRRSDVNWAALADAAPYGNIRRADLQALGVADSTIAARIQDGRWVPSLRGLVRLTTGTPTDDERLDAALHVIFERTERLPSQLQRERDQVRDDLWVAYERALRRPRPLVVAHAPAT